MLLNEHYVLFNILSIIFCQHLSDYFSENSVLFVFQIILRVRYSVMFRNARKGELV